MATAKEKRLERERNDALRALTIVHGENEQLRTALESARSIANRDQCSDAQVLEWAARHDLKGTLTDLRCAFDDAASMTPNVERNRPVGGFSPEGPVHGSVGPQRPGKEK